MWSSDSRSKHPIPRLWTRGISFACGHPDTYRGVWNRTVFVDSSRTIFRACCLTCRSRLDLLDVGSSACRSINLSDPSPPPPYCVAQGSPVVGFCALRPTWSLLSDHPFTTEPSSCMDATSSGCVSCPPTLSPRPLLRRSVGIVIPSFPSFALLSVNETEASPIFTSILTTHGAHTFPGIPSRAQSS